MVLQPEKAPAVLTSALRRAELFRAAGIRRVELVPFDLAFSQQSPETFVERIVLERMRARAVVVGFNYHFGYRRSGTPQVLQTLGTRYGFEVHVIEPCEYAGTPISSSRIRTLVQEGRVDEAAAMLGRPFRTEGVVVAGVGQASRFGLPTANILLDEHLVVPGDGVYVVSVPAGQVSGRTLPGIAYHGRRPTNVPGQPSLDPLLLERVLEVHLFDWTGNLMERHLRVDLHCKLRDDARFASMEALLAQIQRDVAAARAHFEPWAATPARQSP